MKKPLLTILFADRNPGPGRRLRVELRRRGARVLLAGSSDEAIHQAALAPPDIVVMDDDLESDGQIDLGTFVHDAFPHAGIVLLRGNSSPTSSAGGLDLLLWGRKPVADRTLLEVIESTFPGRLGVPTPFWPMTRQILCVDDEPSHIKSLSGFLSRRGYQVSTFENGERALEALSALHPELAVVDVTLPRTQGLDLARKIRERSAGQLPVVLLSAEESDDAYGPGSEDGPSYCLSKPCAPEKVADVIDALVGDLDDQERAWIKS